jgi:DNA-binding IclR family transcriptional regulator
MRYTTISNSEIIGTMSNPHTARTLSTRRVTQQTGKFTRDTPGSQSLERGLQLLRAFRTGRSSLTNAELAERTGLPKPTVSRLTRSLVESGFLSYDLGARAYRLAVVVLSLAQAFRQDEPALQVSLPFMKKVAEGERINVGLAVADKGEMVYLESVRESRHGIFRRISPGSRTPVELTALGRAYLAGLSRSERQKLLVNTALKYGAEWSAIQREINHAVAEVAARGYCAAAWQAGMVSVAAPLSAPDKTLYSINISFPFGGDDYGVLVNRYAPMLIELRNNIMNAWRERLGESQTMA